MEVINKFDGEYKFLSNYWKHAITYKGKLYGSTEAAYQAHKSLDESVHERFTKMGAGTSKKEGQLIEKRSDWETHKYVVMYEVLVEKFKDRVLRGKLMETGDAELVEGNTWHDNCWGDCICSECIGVQGKNALGRTLMKVREEIRNGEL